MKMAGRNVLQIEFENEIRDGVSGKCKRCVPFPSARPDNALHYWEGLGGDEHAHFLDGRVIRQQDGPFCCVFHKFPVLRALAECGVITPEERDAGIAAGHKDCQ